MESSKSKVEYQSLYDYLGKPGGSQLGRNLARFASQRGVTIKKRRVSTPKYEGDVMLYPKLVIKEFFENQNSSR